LEHSNILFKHLTCVPVLISSELAKPLSEQILQKIKTYFMSGTHFGHISYSFLDN